LSNKEPLQVDGNCDHCSKDLSQQEQVKISNQEVFCNEVCSEKTNYGITGKDGFTRISSRKEDLPRPETIGADKIVEVDKR